MPSNKRIENSLSKVSSTTNFIKRILSRHEVGIFSVLLSIMVIFAIFSEQFLTLSNLLTIANQISMIFIIGVGMTIVLILGGMDLSVGYVSTLAGMITALLLTLGINIILAILAGIMVGAIIGFINGILITKFAITDFIVTLATMLMSHGLIFVISEGRSIFKGIPREFLFIGQGRLFGIPMPVIIAIIVFGIASLLMSKFRLGRYIYATGGNREATRLSGVNVDRIRLIGYIICGITAAIAGVIMASRLGSGQPTAGDTFLFDVVGAVVLGGTSLSGGEGTIVGTLIGVAMIGVISNGLTQLGVSFYYQEVIKGLIILFAISYNSIKEKKKK